MMQGETVTRLRGTSTTDRYNNAVIDWSDPDEQDLPGCAVAPTSSSEENTGRTAVIVGMALFVPPGTDLLPTDRVRVRGVVYELDGEVGDWRSPFSGVAYGIEVALKRVAG